MQPSCSERPGPVAGCHLTQLFWYPSSLPFVSGMESMQEMMHELLQKLHQVKAGLEALKAAQEGLKAAQEELKAGQDVLRHVVLGGLRPISDTASKESKGYRKQAFAYYYGESEEAASLVPCMVTGQLLPMTSLTAGHIYRQAWNPGLLVRGVCRLCVCLLQARAVGL